MEKEQKQVRVEVVNKFIQSIANCGRRFFWYSKESRFSRFELAENGRLYFWDDYTNVRLPLSNPKSNQWHVKFSHGGTMKRLIEILADFIKTGKPITNQYVFGPWEDWMCRGDLWGYGDDMEKVRQSALKLGIYKATS